MRVLLRAVALTVVATMLLLASGCRRSTPVGAEGRIEPAGNVLLTGRGGDPVSIRTQRTLRAGDVVEVSDGSATIVLPGGGSLELRPRTIVALDNGPELRNGELLVLAPRGAQVVRAAGSEVRAEGVARLAQALSLRVTAYAGSATLNSGGRSIDVPALRQVAVPALGVVPGAPSPIVISRDDEWDKRFLGEVIGSLDALESLSRGFTDQVVDGGRTAGFYRSLVPALGAEATFQQGYVDQLREPGEVLVGAAISLLGRKGTFAERLAGTISFRAEGAPWALVALDQGVPSFEALRRGVEEAITRAPLQFAVAAPSPPPVAVPAAPSGGRSRRQPTTTPSSTPPPSTPSSTPTSTPPNEPPATPPSAPGDPGLVAPVVDPVVALLDGLLGGGR